MSSMTYGSLGSSRVQASRLCLGTMNFGRSADLGESHAILDAAARAGLNYVDTADCYGNPDQPFASEEIIGAWLAAHPCRRDDVLLATKVHEPTGPGPNERGLSALHIRRACEASLRRLGTDHIDIYQMHHVDRAAPWEEVADAFDILRREGKIIYAGSSNFAGWHLAMMQTTSRVRQTPPLITEQSIYSLANRSIESELLPAARALGVGVVAWSPLAGGLLAGTSAAAVRRVGSHMESLRARYSAQLAATEAIAGDLGVSIAVLSLAWLLHQPGVAAPIVGPRTVQQLESALPAVELELDAEVLARLDQVWPPPGEAPESYAW